MVRQEKIDSWISDALLQIEIPEHIVKWTKQALIESHEQEREYHHGQLQLLESRYRTVKNKIDKTYEDKLDGLVDSDFWSIQNERLNKELVEIESQIASLRTANAAYVEKGVQLMELARQAPELFKTMTVDEKRELANLVLSWSSTNWGISESKSTGNLPARLSLLGHRQTLQSGLSH